MRAASRAGLALVAGLGLVGALAPTLPATAQSTAGLSGPRCPAVVGDQPLSITAPFSGTARPRADDEGQVESTSLHCAYGEGAAPAAEVTVTWIAGAAPCATTEVAVAPSLDAAPFDRLAADLATAVGRACGASPAGGWPLPAVMAGLLAGAGLAVLWLRRRRSADVTVPTRAGPEPTHGDDAPTPPVVEPASVPSVPDVGPVLGALTGAGGRAFAHTGAGQLAVLAAVAYGSGDSVTGDLARAGSLAVLPTGHRPRREVSALAWDRAHQNGAVDR